MIFITIYKIKMIKTCERCWEEFNAHKQKQKFCSLKCKWESQKLPEIPCAVCWKIFHPSKSWVKTCSKECWYKSMSLWDRVCEYCWKTFTPRHSKNKFCSKECFGLAQRTLHNIICPICWKEFRPKNYKTVCCSRTCWQKYVWEKKTEEERDEAIRKLVSNYKAVSKINLSYIAALEELWFNVTLEHCLWHYSYDLKVWNTLIEINPYAFHNSTRAPRWVEPKTNDYHYNKVKYAIDNGYNVIMVRDRTSFDELIQLLDSDFITVQHIPKRHRYNHKTKEHIIWSDYDRQLMEEKWFVLIYDWWEEYIYNLKD